MTQDINYNKIETALHYIESNYKSQPTLDEVAEHVHLSPFHFQKLFKNWAGVSPKRFLQHITMESAKHMLSQSKTILDVSFELGLSGSSRLHDLFVNVEAMTPAEYKNNGKNIHIDYGFHQSPFGIYRLACTSRGICGLDFVDSINHDEAIIFLKKQWGEANIIHNQQVTKNFHSQIFNHIGEWQGKKIPLILKGTNFQIQVWKALLKIPMSSLVSYDQIAANIGKPKASRAVGSAIGQNPIGFIIPCHRVINKIGKIGNYRWGSTRKKVIIGWEMSCREKAHQNF